MLSPGSPDYAGDSLSAVPEDREPGYSGGRSEAIARELSREDRDPEQGLGFLDIMGSVSASGWVVGSQVGAMAGKAVRAAGGRSGRWPVCSESLQMCVHEEFGGPMQIPVSPKFTW